MRGVRSTAGLAGLRGVQWRNERLFSSASSAPLVQNFINGKFEDSTSTKTINLQNPATDEIIGIVPESTPEEMRRAVESASEAFKTWREVSTPNRVFLYFFGFADNTIMIISKPG